MSVRLRALLRRESMEAELDEEFRYHLESEIARNIAGGLSPDPARFAAVRAFALDDVDAGAVEQIHTLELYRAPQVYPFVATHWVASALGLIALLLTLTGIYGVLSYVVAQRRKELGIRLALGASAGTIVGLVLRHALGLTAIGLAVGGTLAVAVSSIFASSLFMFDTFDSVAYAGAGAMVLGACLVATYVPSRRAAAVQPLEALRSD